MYEEPIADFLDKQIEAGLVLDYSFCAPPLTFVFTGARNLYLELDKTYD